MRPPAWAIALVAVVTLLAVISATGCDGDPEVWQPPELDPASTTSWVVLVDLSQSTRRNRQDFVDGLRAVLDGVKPGDRFSVLGVERTAVNDARYLFEQQVPTFPFTPSPAPKSDNQLYIDNYNYGESMRYESGLETWTKEHAGQLETEVMSAVEQSILTEVSSPSDLFGGLYVAGTTLSGAPGKKRLVLFTDGRVKYGGLDWQHTRVKTAQVDAVVKDQERSGSVPDLEGVEVIMIGTNGDDAARYAALRKAWVRYFEKVGARLEPQNFVRRFSIFQLEEWLTSPTSASVTGGG